MYVMEVKDDTKLNFWIYISLQLKYNFNFIKWIKWIKIKTRIYKIILRTRTGHSFIKLMPHMDIYTFGQLNFGLTRVQLALKAQQTSEELSVKIS